MNSKEGYIDLILFSLFIGTVGIFVKLLQNFNVHTIIFFRYFIATLFIFLVAIFGKKWRELLLTSPFKTLLVGLSLGIASLFYFSAILKTSISNAVFLLYTAPIFSVLLAKLFFKEKIQKETIIGIIITLVGIVFILDPRTFSFSSTQTIGNLMGLASGFFYAAQGLLAKDIMKKVSGYYTAFWQSLIITIMFLFFVKIGSVQIAINHWWKFLGLGILGAGIPTILFMRGIQKVPAQQIFIITSLEPLMGTIFALLFLREFPTFMTLIGAFFIFYGVYRITYSKARSPYNEVGT